MLRPACRVSDRKRNLILTELLCNTTGFDSSHDGAARVFRRGPRCEPMMVSMVEVSRRPRRMTACHRRGVARRRRCRGVSHVGYPPPVNGPLSDANIADRDGTVNYFALVDSGSRVVASRASAILISSAKSLCLVPDGAFIAQFFRWEQVCWPDRCLAFRRS